MAETKPTLTILDINRDTARREQVQGDFIEKRIADVGREIALKREGWCSCFGHDEWFPGLPKRHDYIEGQGVPTICGNCQRRAKELYEAGKDLPVGNRSLPTALVDRGSPGTTRTLWVPRPGAPRKGE